MVTASAVPPLDELTALRARVADLEAERDRAEQALQDVESLYRRAITAADGVAYARRYADEAYSFMGEGIEKITGYRAEEMTPALFDSLLEETVVTQSSLSHADAVARARAGNLAHWRADYRLRTRDGGFRWVADTSLETFGPDGRSLGSVGIMLDITERKRVEQLLVMRAEQLATVAEVSTIISTLSDPQSMLQAVVDLTKARFALYHAHVYVLNQAGDTLSLTAGAGDVGRAMVAQGRRIALTQERSLVARAGRTRQGVIVNNVRVDAGFLPHPLLPDTRSEMAVPMIIGDQLLGVFDVQSTVVDHFTQEDLSIQTTLAAQVAVALQNARSFERLEATLQEMNVLTRRLTHAGWQTYVDSTAGLARHYRYDLEQVTTVPDGQAEIAPEATFVQPLVVQGEPIGRLLLEEPTVHADDLTEVMSAVSERLSAHIENLRLAEQTEKRASELEAVARVSATVSATLEAGRLLQTVVDLAQERFNLYHAHVYLLDETDQTLALAAGAGHVGAQMAAEGRRIPLEWEPSLVARAGRTREAVMSNNVRADTDFVPHPLLPETRSELAVPMVVGDKLLGVFDVQSDRVNAFTLEDTRIQATLAAQVAVALNNANLYADQAATVTRLRELDHLKSSFLANMSHELRTPLNSILGFTEVILEELDGPLTEQMENDLRIVYKNGQHLLNLINDVLDMAKIESGKLTLNPERFDLAEILEEVIGLTASLARTKDIELKLEASFGELLVEADRMRLRQVFINLVNNAIKFTDEGSIVLRAEHQGDHIRASVRDTGLGIPADHLEKIFHEFTQVDTSTTRKVGGTGLGLPISRHLVEMHGGRLWAESTGRAGPEGGSVFVLELPVTGPGLTGSDQD